MELLDGVRGKVLSRVSYHEWASDEYTSLDWVELVFSDGSQICLHLGCGEPSVEVLGCFDPEKERAEMFEMFGENVSQSTRRIVPGRVNGGVAYPRS